MAELTVLAGPEEGRTFELAENAVIGRHESCDIRLDDDAISRRHAVISAVDDAYYIEDLGSSNGTFVNGEQVARKRLAEGDTIKLSHVVLAFRERPRERETQVTIIEEGQRTDSAVMRQQEMVQSLLRDTTTVTSMDQLQDLHDKLLTVTRFSKEVRSTLDLNALLRKVLGLLFEIFPQAERGFIMLRDDDGELRPVASRNAVSGGEIRISSTVLNVAIEERKAILSNNPVEDERFSSGESIVHGGMRSLMVSPLLSEDEAIGVMHVDTTRRSAPFSTDDLALFSGLADQAAVAVSNAFMHQRLLRRQRFEQELNLAQTVQRSFLPERVPSIGNLELAFHYALARQVGGDFYDLKELPGGEVSLSIGDVSGKGIPAALLMAKTISEMRSAAQPGSSPAQVLAMVNSMMLGSIAPEMFVTALVCIVNPATGEVVIGDAGHNPPLVKRASGEVEFLELEKGFPLGVIDEGQYGDFIFRLAQGDTLLFYTDGLTDALGSEGESYGLDRMREAVESAAPGAIATVESLVESVRTFSGLATPFDDLTMIAISPK